MRLSYPLVAKAYLRIETEEARVGWLQEGVHAFVSEKGIEPDEFWQFFIIQMY